MDIHEIAASYAAEGPFATVYLDTASDVENAGPKLELQWKNVLRELDQHDIDAATKEALTQARGEHSRGGTRVLVGAQGRALLATSMPGPPPAGPGVHAGALPHLLSVVERLGRRLPHLVVLTDRQGADILAYGEGAQRGPVETGAVTGSAPDITKVHAGGWSERRYQARVEEGWDHNAKEVAAVVDAIARDVGPRLVVATGDVRALGLLHDNLPQRLSALWRVVPGGRGEDGGGDPLAQHVAKTVEEQVGADLAELLADFEQERGQADRAVAGTAETVDALRRGQVDLVLVSDQLDETASGWFGDESSAIGMSEDEVAAMGESRPRRAPLIDVLMRATFGTGAQVRVVPGDLAQSPPEGVGALLRYGPPGRHRLPG